MFRIFIAALCILFASSAAAQTVSVLQPPAAPCTGAGKALQWTGALWDCVTISGGGGGSVLEGIVSVRRVGGTWQGFDEHGVSICSATATKCLNEVIAYAKGHGFPTHVFGLGSGDPFSMVDQQILSVASSQTTPVYCWGCEFRFDNHVSAKDGILFDTTLYSGFYNHGGRIVYCGGGFGIRFQPKTNLAGIVWTMHNDFDLGSVQGDASCPTPIGGLVAVDLTQACDANQPLSSAFVNNHLTGFLIGGSKALANVRYYSPNCAQSAGGENWFFFWDNKDAASVEVNIGTYQGNTLDLNIGTNWWIGNIAHTWPGSGYSVMTNSADDVFLQSSINVYNAGPLANVYLGPQGCNNVFSTTQTINPPGGFFQNNACGNLLHRP